MVIIDFDSKFVIRTGGVGEISDTNYHRRSMRDGELFCVF